MPKRIKRMNKWLFMAVFLSPLLFVCVMSCMLLLEGLISPVILGIIALVGIIMFSVSMPVFRYSTWAALYDEEHYMPSKRLADPIDAVLFSRQFVFSPEKGYWTSMMSDRYYFFPHYLFMDYFEEYVKRYNLQVPSFNRSMYRVFHCFTLVSMIFPFVVLFLHFLFVPMIICFAITYFIFLITVSQTCDAINALADEVEKNVPLSRS